MSHMVYSQRIMNCFSRSREQGIPFETVICYLSFFETVLCSFLCVLRLIGLIGMIESSHHHISSALFTVFTESSTTSTYLYFTPDLS